MYDTILVSTDGSEAATAAARYGLLLATAVGADVHVLSVVDPDRYVTDVIGDVDDLVRRQRAELDRQARAAVARAVDDAPDVPVETHVVEGRPADVLSETVGTHDADLVVMGTHGRSGLDRYLLGSLTERTIRTASVPVLAVGADHPVDRPLEDVVAATDGSAGADRAVDHAIAIAAATDATLHALTVGGDDGPARRVADRAADAGVDATATVRTGAPYEGIVAYADAVGAELVVVGTRGRTGIERALLGSVAERVLRTSPVPVLVAGG